MYLNNIEDPRSNLDKARRSELYEFAKNNGVTEINDNMPAILMREILRGKGLTRIPVPDRRLGQTNQPNPRPHYQNTMAAPGGQQPAPKGVAVDAVADLARQYQQEQRRPLADSMTIGELRKECKARGIKLERRDNMTTIRAKLRGENAS